jgi:putative acetyltransferase
VDDFVIEVDDPRRDDVRRLLERHRLFASGVMPPDGVHVLDPENDALDSNVTLFSVRIDGELLGIGSIKQLDTDHAELKSMHTAITARRRGVGRALLDHLLAVAAAPRDSPGQPRDRSRGSLRASASAVRIGRVRAVRALRRVR